MNQEDFANYLSAFNEQQDVVQALTRKLVLQTIGLEQVNQRAQTFLEQHDTLYRKYNAALDLHSQSDEASILMVDTTVRGIDRAPTLLLTQLEDSIETAVENKIRESNTYQLVIELILTSVVVLVLMQLYILAKRSTYSSYIHSVTGLYNKKALYLTLDKLKLSAQSITLLLADIDNFKAINEVRGVGSADKLLKQLASLFKNNHTVRAFYIPSNLFVLVSTHINLPPDEVEFQMIGQFESLQEQLKLGGINMSFTTCLCTFETRDKSTDDIFNLCSAAMQEAKVVGKGLTHNYKTLKGEVEHRQAIMCSALSIEELIINNQLVLYGQAIVPNNAVNSIPHVEVLLRIELDGKHISPFIVLQAAEKYDKSVLIDHHVVSHVIEFMKAQSAPLHCSINLSAQSLNHKFFVTFLIDKVSNHPEIAKLLTFELIETSIIKNLNVAKELFNRLRALGCKVAMDDFGVGESSLRYLMELSVDVVKIDGSFIKQLEHNEKARSLVTAIVSIYGYRNSGRICRK